MAAFKLPRLKANLAIVDSKGQPLGYFLRLFNIELAQRLESAVTGIEEVQANQSAIVADLAIQVDRLKRQIISTSHVDALTFSAESEGATAKITISDNIRVYVDEEVPVNGDTLTGLDYNKTYAVYYDDPEIDGGTVTYVATLNPTEAVTSATNPYRHLLGVVTTPAAAGNPPNGGGGTRPPGYPLNGLYVEP